jgi:hypothetical protein
MPFSKGYEGVYDQSTLKQLQDILEFVWLAIADGTATVSREDVASLVLAAHESGMTPERIKEHVLDELLQPRAGVPKGSVHRVRLLDA